MSSSITQFNHLRIPLDEIQKATNNFSENNIIGKGGFGNVYKGHLLRSGEYIKFSARRLDRSQGQGDMEFWTEISVLSSLKHPNIVSLIGFCDEKGEKIIINRHEAKGSLCMYLSDPTVTWEQRLRISIGVARAISYIHYEEGRNYSIIHRNINSSTILLDDKFEAKLSGFEFSIKDSMDRMERYISSEVIRTQGYMDPESIKSGDVTQESDIYKFGVVLCEIMCGRKAFLPKEQETNVFLAPLARFHLQNDTLQDIINPDIFNQMALDSLKKFVKEVRWSITKDRLPRPDINKLLFNLSEALDEQLRSSNFLPSNDFKFLRIPLDEIQKATNNFSEKNIIGKGGFGNVYKGKLLLSGELIKISARRLDRSQGLGDIEFLTEVSLLSSLKHPNIVSLIGFCDENGEKIIINRFVARGSLWMYLSDPILTWERRLRISIGVARAISYIHNEEGRNYSIIHRNINSSTILIDDNFEAKLSGFEFSIKDSVDRKERYISLDLTSARGYADPETIKSGVTTQKSDIYSFGVVLCEIMCGREAFLPNGQATNSMFLAPLARFHLLNDTLQDIINPDIFNQMAPESLKRFAAAAHYSIKKDRLECPDMNMLLFLLNEALDEQLRSSNCESSLDVEKDENDALQLLSKDELGVVVESTTTSVWKVNKLEHLRIGLIDIQLATNNFSMELELFSDEPYAVYKGDLDWFDRKYVSSLEGKNKGKLPNRHYNVRIMCLNNATAVDRFYKEIEILSTCKHENIDSLLGFCDEGSHMILCCEGDTYKRLGSYLSSPLLTWDIRLKICLNVAHGLNYLHNEMEDQKMVIHRQLNSFCIFLDGNWQGTKVTGFGLSTFRENQDEDALHLRIDHLNQSSFFSMAPEFRETGKATKKSDIYSFGLVMFEILCGVNYHVLRETDREFQAEHWFKDRIIKRKVARAIREENRGNKLFLKEGPNKDSLDTFIKITEQCLAVNPKQRPTLQVIIMELRKALTFQKNHKDHLRMSFKDIESATQNFSRANDIGGGGFGRVYKGELASEHGSSTIVAKRLDTRHGQGDQQFYNELHILSEYKHENVISLVGYNNDEQERIIVYEYASKGSLDKYLNDASLTWINRLNICIDVARGLAFLHGGVQEHEAVIHRDMKTANILLFDDWKAKVADFGLSLICTIDDETNYVIDHACGTRGYLDPVSEKSRTFTKESDIYSLGVILFEILYGKSTNDIKQRENQFLHSLVEKRLEEGRLDEVVFNAIKNQIVPQAKATFQAIAYQCLHVDREKRPTAQDVLVQLQKALELQVKDVPVSKEP